VRPAKIWKTMTPETRQSAAEAFWLDEEAPDVDLQKAEAVLAIAKRMNFRAKSVQALSVDGRARALARLPDVSDAVATRALIAFHFAQRRGLMAAFLDALGVEHDNGMITNEDGIPAPDLAALEKAIAAVRAGFPEADVTLYLRTLAALDEDTWKGLAGLVD
jgi:hypothetical protein